MNSLFYHCHSLTRIDLPSNFIIKMTNLTAFFSDCHSLTSINLDNFHNTNPSIGLNMNYMFSGCYSLTSLNFLSSNNVSNSFNGIFFNCPNLTYVNFSFVNSSQTTNNLFNDNISEFGTLILNDKYYQKSLKNYKPPKNWTLILY